MTEHTSFFKKWIWVFPLLVIPFLFLYLATRNPDATAQLYQQKCANCHMDDGTGLRGVIPPLANADYLKQNREQLACVIKYGLSGEVKVNGVVYDQAMPPNPNLTEADIANLINYISNNWGNKANFTSSKSVKQQLENCQSQKALENRP